MTTYSPAQAAEVSGFSIDTLRYYEREGILRSVARTPGGHRTYTEADLSWLDLVHCLRDTGMPIVDLRRYAELSLDEATLAARVALLDEHDRRVQESIDALRGQQEKLREKIAWYRSQGV
jgi:DNA-binding transcriptional MerR regulator